MKPRKKSKPVEPEPAAVQPEAKKGRKKPRPFAASNPHTATAMLHIEPGLKKALDQWATMMTERGPGPKWTRSDVIRATLVRAVNERMEKGMDP